VYIGVWPKVRFFVDFQPMGEYHSPTVSKAAATSARERRVKVVIGYVLIRCSSGRVREVCEALLSLSFDHDENRVLQADPVTGEVDVIATIQAQDLSAMNDLVFSKIQGTDGVVRTTTCLTVNLGGTS